MSHQSRLLAELAVGPLLADGGMGTLLMGQGMTADESSALWNAEHPDIVIDIHRRYRRAGCQLITTNTFQACRTTLEPHGAADRVRDINLAAARNARRGGGDDAIVLADVGPFGDFLEPVGDITESQLQDIFTQQLQALHDGGADAALIETMSDPGELALGVRAAKVVADWPVIATFAFQKQADGGFRTMMGTTVADAMDAAIDAGADVVGSNCGTGLELPDYLELARQLTAAVNGRRPVILQPNAGSPRIVAGRSVHPAAPRDMAAVVQPLLDAGVRVIGGCCGTTPEHLHAMARVMNVPHA